MSERIIDIKAFFVMLAVIFAKKQGRMIAERKMGVRKRAFASWDFYLKEPIFFSSFPTRAQWDEISYIEAF